MQKLNEIVSKFSFSFRLQPRARTTGASYRELKRVQKMKRMPDERWKPSPGRKRAIICPCFNRE